MSLAESLRYLTCTRPDIMFGVGLISRFIDEPKSIYWKAAKRILRYIKGTLTHGLLYSFCLVGYFDNDWGDDLNDRKSTTSFVF